MLQLMWQHCCDNIVVDVVGIIHDSVTAGDQVALDRRTIMFDQNFMHRPNTIFFSSSFPTFMWGRCVL